MKCPLCRSSHICPEIIEIKTGWFGSDDFDTGKVFCGQGGCDLFMVAMPPEAMRLLYRRAALKAERAGRPRK